MLTIEQVIIQKVESKLPIIAFPERDIIPKLRESFEDDGINLRSVFEIHKMYDMRDEGGITCELRPKGVKSEEVKSVFICSITHLKIKRGEPLYREIEKYRLKRIRRISRQNRMN